MDDIKELVTLVTRQKIKQIEIISEGMVLSKQSKKLYDGVLEGHYKSDKEAAYDIYGTNEKSESYKKLKYRLKQRLVNTLFFIDIQAYARTGYQKALIRNFKNVGAIKIMIDRGARVTAYRLAEITLKSALKFDLTEVAILLVPDLLRHYGMFENDKRKHAYYEDLLTQLKHIHNAEIEAEILYVKAAKLLIESKALDLKKISALIESLSSLKVRYNDVNSFKFKFTSLSASYFLNLLAKNYKELDNICVEAISFFSKKTDFSKFPLFDFNLKHAIVHIYFERYTDSVNCLNTCNQLNPVQGNYNWFIVNSYRLLVHILTRNYHDAFPLVSEVIEHPKFKKSYPLYRQQWLVKEAYMQFLIESGNIVEFREEIVTKRKFRLNRFLNDVDLLTKDKKGMHIPILIIEVLFLLLRGESDKLDARLGALRQYNYRYLRTNKRAHAFTKMLTGLVDYEYNTERIERKMAKYHKVLEENPMELTEQEIQIEIIPYEDLWEMVMGVLRN